MEPPALFCIRDLVLDVAGQRAWLRHDELALTRLEFDVLLYLLQNTGRLVSDTELLRAIWGSDAVTGDAALRTVIARLRRKLGDDPRQPRYIATVWGRGYRFEPDQPGPG